MTATPTEEEFAAEALAFLDANAKPRQERATGWGEGSDRVGLLEEKTAEQELEELREAKAWRALVFDAGFGWITGPEQYGGRGLPGEYERMWQSLENDYEAAGIEPFAIGLGIVDPTILAYAVE